MNSDQQEKSAMRFGYHRISAWPPLAWVAQCEAGRGCITIHHGSRVETWPEWFCEAAWPGPFADGDFDHTDLVAGTGGRIRDGVLRFVAPGNTVDRLLSLQVGNELFVANSLAALLAITQTRIDPSYPHYYEDFTTIIQGLSAFKRMIPSSKGMIRITVFGTLSWDGEQATSSMHKVRERDFSTFEKYLRFMRSNMAALADNVADPRRQHSYKFMATTSSGYDSPTIAQLAREAGCEEALCIDADRFGQPENGAEIAQILGLRPVRIERNAWRKLERPEVYFVAADGTSEAVALSSAGKELCGRVLLTGYHGDKIWGKDTENQSADIVRGDASGLSLSEYRLWVGFIHCPIAFWGVRQIRDIVRLSNADELRPWDVPGDYSRPIPRRIVESAGVPRQAFGCEKKASAIAFKEFLSPASLDAYRSWLARHRMEWIKRGRLPPPLSASYEQLAGRTFNSWQNLLRRTPLLWRLSPDDSLDRPSRLRRHAFAWAVEEISQNYRASFEQAGHG